MEDKIKMPVTSGWPGFLLTAAIVAARAMQPGSSPMESWSWWSWILMSVPVFLPSALAMAALAVWTVLSGAAAGIEKLCGRKA